MRLGIVASEFFDPRIGRMGGFGWAARQVARFFRSRPDLGVEVVFIGAGFTIPLHLFGAHVHDTPLIAFSSGKSYGKALEDHKPDLCLTIDYRHSYRKVLCSLPNTPVVVWVRDPRPPEVEATLATLRIPGQESSLSRGIKSINYHSLASVLDGQRSVQFTTPAPSLRKLAECTYRCRLGELIFLPNIVDLKPGKVTKHPKPRVIFLARHDPIKRPWLFVELARRLPRVEFLMLGQSHFRGPGSWEPSGLPNNLVMVGHVDGEEKRKLLSSAWVLINTSIHEALATSFIEALACETPLLCCTNQEELASRFGIFTGRYDGDGVQSLPRFTIGLQELLEDRDRRTSLGQRGREWVEHTHNEENFLAAFGELCGAAGVGIVAASQ
ncbi:MAG: glycosyltransferase family 4 protein [Nitrospira sp.]|nr:glycosyltransferase family 4 protein [Nitrospira sp.]